MASTGGTALVTAMVTDSWEGVKARVARVLGRGDRKQTEANAARLEDSRRALAELSGPDLERARAEQEIVWRTRLGDLLAAHPEAEGDLRAVVADVQSLSIGPAGQFEQHAAAFGHAQQAILGHGVQNVNFGDRCGPGSAG